MISLVLLIGYARKTEDIGSGSDVKRKGFMRLFSLVPGVGAVIAFILTENMNNPMIFTDTWTMLMVAIAAVQALVVYMSLRNSDSTDDVQPQNV